MTSVKDRGDRPGTYIPCVFQTKYKGLDKNVRLALLGDSPVLGEWTARKAVIAEHVRGDLYEVVVMLQIDSICHFKWCIVDKSHHIVYCESHKQRAFKVEDPLMYIQAPWDKDCSVIPVKNFHLSNLKSKHKMVLVTFQMNLPEGLKEHNQQLYLLGNDPALGGWLIYDARLAQYQKNVGRVTAYLAVGSVIKYKWLLKTHRLMDTEEIWEDGPNRSIKIENHIMTIIECDWGEDSQDLWMCERLGVRLQEFLQPTSSPDVFDAKIGLFKPHFKYVVYAGLTAGLTAAVGYGLFKGITCLKELKS